MFFVIFVWTYGLKLFKGHIDKGQLRKEIIKTLLNPSIIAVVIGVLIVLFNIELPKIINNSINSVGSISGPLSMIIIGVIVSKSRIGNNFRDWKLYYGLTIKMVVLPLILIFVSLLIDRSVVSNSVIIIASMPAAAMTSIFAESYNKEEDFASIIVLLTTLLSVISIPILVRILV